METIISLDKIVKNYKIFELTEEERADLQKSVEVVAKQMEATGL